MGEVVAVVLAGGRGRRFGSDRNKVLLPLHGHPVIEWSIRAFAHHRAIDSVLLVGHPDDLDELRQIAAPYGVSAVIRGGAERADSERAALEHLRSGIVPGRISAVLIHDGARPLVSAGLITRVAALAPERGVVPVLDAPPLLRRTTNGLVPASTHRLGRAQTPQGGPAGSLLAAYDAAARDGFAGTDTVSFLERSGVEVRAVDGDCDNLKITFAGDLPAAARSAARWQ